MKEIIYQVKVNDCGTFWMVNGELHREDGPAVEWAGGNKSWYRNGDLHREDGPAVENVSGYKAWYRDGKLHREDGPAIEWADGDKSWYLNGEYLTEKEFNQRMNPKPTCEGKIVEIEGVKYTLTATY